MVIVGPVFSEVTSAMYTGNLNVPTVNYIYGLGGRDIKVEHIKQVYNDLKSIDTNTDIKKYLGGEINGI